MVLVASPVLAQAPGPNVAQLDYVRGNLASCPEESYFRLYVAGRLGGEDPFPAQASRRIKLTLRRPPEKPRRFAADVAMYDQTGARLGGDELSEADCVSVVKSAGSLVVSWLVPLSVPAPAPKPKQAQERPEPAPPPPPPPAPPPPVEPTQEAKDRPTAPPPVEPRASVFGGKAGLVRAAAYGLTAGGLAMGTTFVLAAGNKITGARQLGGTLPGNADASGCNSGTSAGKCQQIAGLVQQHDKYTDLAIGSFIAAGVVGGLATASIWIAGSPPAATVQVKASAGRSGGGLTVRRSW